MFNDRFIIREKKIFDILNGIDIILIICSKRLLFMYTLLTLRESVVAGISVTMSKSTSEFLLRSRHLNYH